MPIQALLGRRWDRAPDSHVWAGASTVAFSTSEQCSLRPLEGSCQALQLRRRSAERSGPGPQKHFRN